MGREEEMGVLFREWEEGFYVQERPWPLILCSLNIHVQWLGACRTPGFNSIFPLLALPSLHYTISLYTCVHYIRVYIISVTTSLSTVLSPFAFNPSSLISRSVASMMNPSYQFLSFCELAITNFLGPMWIQSRKLNHCCVHNKTHRAHGNTGTKGHSTPKLHHW